MTTEISQQQLDHLADATQLVFATVKRYLANDNAYYRQCNPTSEQDDMNLIRAADSCLRSARIIAGID